MVRPLQPMVRAKKGMRMVRPSARYFCAAVRRARARILLTWSFSTSAPPARGWCVHPRAFSAPRPVPCSRGRVRRCPPRFFCAASGRGRAIARRCGTMARGKRRGAGHGVWARGPEGTEAHGRAWFRFFYITRQNLAKTSQKSRKTVAKTSQKPRKNLPKTSQKPRENLAKTSLGSVSFIRITLCSFII